jgi:hypothetical protein
LLPELGREAVVTLGPHESRSSGGLKKASTAAGHNPATSANANKWLMWHVDGQLSVSSDMKNQLVRIHRHREPHSTIIVGIFVLKIPDEFDSFQKYFFGVHEFAVVPFNCIGHVFICKVAVALYVRYF